MRVAIIGAGGHAKVVWDCLVAAGHEVVGFVVDEGPGMLLGLPVVSSLAELDSHDATIVAIGNNRVRREKFLALQAAGGRFVNAVHPSAVLSPRIVLGEGNVILAGVVVNIDASLGDNVILNTGATIDHDCAIASHTHIAPGCHLAGNVKVAEGAFLGVGTCCIPGVRVGAWATSGAGSVLVRDVAEEALVVGVPARARTGSR